MRQREEALASAIYASLEDIRTARKDADPALRSRSRNQQ
jgi:hypothetical protein